MIHKIYSDLPSFKNLTFEPGLNIVLADRHDTSTDKQSRNGSGKSSLLEIVHFLSGAGCPPTSLFRRPALEKIFFGIRFDLKGELTEIRRSASRPGEIDVVEAETSEWPVHPSQTLYGRIISNNKWQVVLAKLMFNLDMAEFDATEATEEEEADSPSSATSQANKVRLTLRMLFPYFVRRQSNGGFISPFTIHQKQQLGDTQMAVMYLLGLDWKIAQDLENVRKQEKIVKAMRAVDPNLQLGGVMGKMADVRTRIALNENQIQKYERQIENFQVLGDYGDLEKEASQLTIEAGRLSDENTTDLQTIDELIEATRAEKAPSYDNLKDLYAEAGVILPEFALRRFEEVRQFHDSVISNRRSYLQGELNAARQRVEQREAEKRRIEQRRSHIMRMLKAHGALDQFVQLNAELAQIKQQNEGLKSFLEFSKHRETQKTELEIKRFQLQLRLGQDFGEQSEVLSEAISIFEDISSRLYEGAGQLLIEESGNGPIFNFRVDKQDSEAIKTMQIFCFDMMLARLCALRKIGPGFLIHDSHIFDGADARQVSKAIEVGAAMAEEYHFQYIVTLNSDTLAENWFSPSFDVNKYIVQPKLTDEPNGGLFGRQL